jgi:hypothetical protein
MSDPFREEYRVLSTEEKLAIRSIKAAAGRMLADLENVPDPRYKALAVTSLEQCVMWAVKGITQ